MQNFVLLSFLKKNGLLITCLVSVCLVIFLSIYLYTTRLLLSAAHDKLAVFEDPKLNPNEQRENIVDSSLIEINQRLSKKEKFYSAEAHWLGKTLGYHDKNLFSILDYGFQLNQNKVPVGINCDIDFEDSDHLQSYYNAQHIVSCSIGKCTNGPEKSSSEEKACEQNLEEFISDLSLVSPIKIIIDSVSKEDVDFSAKYQLQKNEENRRTNYEFIFFSPKAIQPLNYPEIYSEVYGRYVLLIRTYETVEDSKIISFAEAIIQAVQFVNLADSDKMYY